MSARSEAIIHVKALLSNDCEKYGTRKIDLYAQSYVLHNLIRIYLQK